MTSNVLLMTHLSATISKAKLKAKFMNNFKYMKEN